jgi:hypothetical protein
MVIFIVINVIFVSGLLNKTRNLIYTGKPTINKL